MLWELSDVINSIPEAKKEGESPRFKDIFEKSDKEMCAILFKDQPDASVT